MIDTIIFRLNAGNKYGLGHLSRNLALSLLFLESNFNCVFLIHTDNKRKIEDFIQKKKRIINAVFFEKYLNHEEDISSISQIYESNKSFLILDHYEHDFSYQLGLKNKKIKWAQFDYKKADKIIADIVINPNIGVKKSDYKTIVNRDTTVCVGENLAIIDREFLKLKLNKNPKRILISMGGGEYPKNILNLILFLVSNKKYYFDIISTQDLFNDKLNEFQNIQIHNNPQNIAKIYARNHIGIVAGGVTTYELAYLNIPMIVIPYTENQKNNAKIWQSENYAIMYSSSDRLISDINNFGLELIIEKLIIRYKHRKIFFDGKGVYRLFNKIRKIINGKKF